MNVLIIAYTPQSTPIAYEVAEAINGCIYVTQAPPLRQDYWAFLTAKATEFGADYVIEVSANSKYHFRYRNVRDLFHAYEATCIEDANFITAD